LPDSINHWAWPFDSETVAFVNGAARVDFVGNLIQFQASESQPWTFDETLERQAGAAA